jgi:hypothetical protein
MQQQGGGGQMDWYSGGSTYNAYGSGSSSGAAYNYAPSSYSYNTNFEDEPPLLEGPPPPARTAARAGAVHAADARPQQGAG